MTRRRSRLTLALALAAASAASAESSSQSWEYRSYQRDPTSGQYSKDRYRSSKITVEEVDGKAIFRMQTTGKGDVCFSRSELPAEVERTAEAIIVTVTPTLTGCEPFRYLIRKDGSGGIRMVLRNEKWVSDGLDHGLTPLK